MSESVAAKTRGGRARTGTLEPAGTWSDGSPRFRGRVRLGDGTKSERFDVPSGRNERQARAYVAEMQAQEDAHGGLLAKKRAALRVAGIACDDGSAEAWVDAWLAAKKARGQTSTGDRRAHYLHHIVPVLGAKHVRAWTADGLRALVAALDAKIAAGEIAAKTARNVWGTATKMVGDAARSKVDALRCRTDNPARSVEGPERGEDRSKQFLYPDEFLRVVSCPDVPQRWRRALALAVYLFPRAGELRALRWEDVDLEHGTVHIHRAFERRTRTVKATKTKTARRFALEPAIVPLLEAMHGESGGEGLVCPLPNRLASRLREWLAAAGVTRRELLDEESRTTKPLGFHDLRATGLTWMAVRGDDPLKIMQRAGHEDFATSQLYIRTAEAVRDGFGSTFPTLPGSLLVQPTKASGPSDGPTRKHVRETMERDTGFEPATSSLGSWHSTN